MSLNQVLSRIDEDLDDSIARLIDFLRIPSVSTDPEFTADCDKAADWLVNELTTLGIDAQKRPTPGHPMVVGHVGEGAPHLLFYGHYDVQPVDPIELWDNDPFDPQVEQAANGPLIRGRGSSDDKGQLMTFIEALRAWKEVKGDWPCKITFFFEGEEESGSPSLVPFMEENRDELKSDIALICDTALFESKTPAIVTMLRGMLGEEFTITAPSKDLHSGFFGGIAQNPIRVLSHALAALHDDQGRVTIPDFYKDVPELPDEIRAQWQGLSFDHNTFLNDVDLSEPAGETDRTPLEMIWSRPTCEINGIWGGYQGEGFKTVLPSQASAKVSFRLVGQQDPHEIRNNFRKMVEGMLPVDCKIEWKGHGASPASVADISGELFESARTALSDEWNVPAAYIGCGGSIPIAGHFQDILGTEPMLVGFAKDDDQIHSPNEKYDIESFHKGIRSWARILEALT